MDTTTPEERLPEERLPEERLPEERLPEERLYLALSLVPAGSVIAYGELANAAGLPGRAR